MFQYFQSRHDGHPMAVLVRDGRVTVRAIECDDARSCEELGCAAVAHASSLSRAVSECSSVEDAVYVLRAWHGYRDAL
jgi:hypothetical protein